MAYKTYHPKVRSKRHRSGSRRARKNFQKRVKVEVSPVGEQDWLWALAEWTLRDKDVSKSLGPVTTSEWGHLAVDACKDLVCIVKAQEIQ